ncbi:autoinducer-2 kinase [Sulfurovum sp. NBC37-1]|uniref:autoinducer-2 kinase n=1 Tax=Sulfurovum sp. (strain NBC37-1) TaxID=387093 RepID=UPI000158788A|nr:autoinducer-2 kinase [Sulfurovum sp. NBC37-1]BAF71079.1 sugar kinase [Sulfurovum sp. NBC37-1]
MQYLMAIDAGTGSIRVVIFDTKGNQVSASQQEWTHIEEEGVPNSMTFDTEHNWILVTACIRDALDQARLQGSDIAAVSATSMREGIVLYDENGEALWGVANVDARAAEEVRYLKEQFPDIEEAFYALSGQTFALGALPRILWLKNNRPKLYEEVASVSMIGDWILAKLSGIIATDPSNGGTTGIFSLKERTWVPSMAEKVGLKADIFPSVLEPGTAIGSVTDDAADETGLSTATKVVMGGGDVQLGSAGLGVVKEGQVAILGGSFWQQVVNIKSDTPPPEDMGIRVNPHVVEGLSQAEGITFFSGLIMRWFRDAFCDLEKREAEKSDRDAYAILEEKAKAVPVGSYGIIPIFSDSMKYGKWYHAAPSFINLSIDPEICNKASMFRSLEENACIVSEINLEKVKAFTGLDFEEIVFAGGASKGELWCQILSDVTGCRIRIPTVTEATALGAAMAAGVGTGIYESIPKAAQQLVTWDKTYHPNMDHHRGYREIAEKWQEVYAAQLALVDRGLTTSMWKAPGV